MIPRRFVTGCLVCTSRMSRELQGYLIRPVESSDVDLDGELRPSGLPLAC